MKCLMRMFAEADKGVVFFETVLSLSKQKHTFIECVPLPWSVYDDIPAYFKVIDSSLPLFSLAANEN
jgi:Protein similar to CwfJ C-terminus 1